MAVHGVADHDNDSEWDPLRPQLSPETFARQVALIGRYYTWVPLDVAVDIIEGNRPLQPNAVAITFDDGYENNKSIALPILEKYNIIPTFYVPTGFIDNRKTFWFDRFDYVIQQIRDPYRIDLKGETFEFLPGDRSNQQAVYERLRSHLKIVFESD
ncbi:MAG: polysaccharide deacetylase family protein, partial [Planctomycetota bacterium]